MRIRAELRLMAESSDGVTPEGLPIQPRRRQWTKTFRSFSEESFIPPWVAPGPTKIFSSRSLYEPEVEFGDTDPYSKPGGRGRDENHCELYDS